MYKGFKLADTSRNPRFYKTPAFNACMLFVGILTSCSLLGAYRLFKIVHIENNDYFRRRIVHDSLIDELNKRMLTPEDEIE